MMSDSNSSAEINIAGGSLLVPHADLRIGFWCDNTCSTEINISTNGLLSCGDDASDHIKLGAWAEKCQGNVTVNLNEGGTLKAWNIVKEGTGSSTINFDGGTLVALGAGTDGGLVGSGIAIAVGSNGGTIDVGANNVTIAATVSGSGTIIKKGTGTLTFTGGMSEFTGSIVVVEGGAVTVSETGTSATAGVGTTKTDLVFTTDGTTYSWIGGGTPNEDGSYNWTDLQNWSLNGSEPTAYPGSTGAADSQTTDVVYFPGSNTVTVKLTGNAYTKNVLLSGKVTLTGGGTLFARTISGDELTLAGATLRGYQNAKNFADNGLTIACDLLIAESTENSLYLGRKSDNNFCVGIELTGALSGKGVLKIVEERDNMQYVKVSDASEFEGSWIATSAEITDTTRFTDAKQVGRTASYTFNKPYYKNYYAYPFAKQGETFYIGALNGIVYLRGNTDAAARNMTLVIGERNEACSFGGEMSVSSSHMNHIKKVGTETLTYTGTQFTGNLTIESGTFIIGSDNSAPGKIMFTGGALSEAQGVDIDPITKFADDGSTTAAVVVDDWGYPHEWSGALTPARVPYGFTKKGSGTLTLTTSPTYTAKTAIEAGMLVIPSGTTLGELSIAEDAQLFISGADGDTITVGSFSDGDTTKGRVTTPTGTSLSWDGNVGTIVRDLCTYTWTDATGDHAWSTLGNWTVSSGNVQVIPDLLPSSIDIVDFGANTTVTLSDDVEVAKIIIGENVRVCLSAASQKTVKMSGYECDSSSTLALSNIKIIPSSVFGGYWLNLGGSIEIVDGTENAVYVTCARYDKDGVITKPAMNIDITGNLTGKGLVKFGNVDNNYGRAYLKLSGDNSAFGGIAEIYSVQRGSLDITWNSASSGSADACWKVTSLDSLRMFFGFTTGTIEFGSFEGSSSVTLASSSTPTVQIGRNGEDASCGVSFWRGSNSKSANLIKAGNNKVQYSGQISNGNGNGNITIQEGVLDIASGNSLPNAGSKLTMTGGILAISGTVTVDETVDFVDPSGYIKGCETYPICFSNAVSEVHTWSGVLDNSNKAGLTKKGAGTLILSALPAYTGTTTVEDGVLYVINGDYTLTRDSSTAEVTTDKDGYRKFVPASVTVAAPKVVWGDDFAKVTVSAEVNSNYGEGGLSYNLKIGGNVVDGAVGTVNNGVVTFSDVVVSGLNLSRYGDVAVEVTASAGGSQAATSGPKDVMFADTKGWVDENYETTGKAAAGGAWQTAVTYDATTHKAAVVDNRFSATNCTTGDVVTVTIDDVVYTGLSDLTSADTDAQGAVAVGGTETEPKFMLLTKKNDTVGWYEAAGKEPVLETGVYDIVMTFDYISNTYTVTVNGTPLTVGGVAAVPLAKAQTSVKDIDFLGAGSLAAVSGVQYEGKMAIDQNGDKYDTVAEALQANASVKGAVIRLLHGSATTSAEGWNFDNDTKTFVKKVIGLIFLAF